MNHLSFIWNEPTSLAAELSKPIKQVSVEFVTVNSGSLFETLWRSDGTGLRLYTEMHDLAERTEVGVLQFEYALLHKPDEIIADVASSFDCEITASKLIIHESGTNAESGVILKASNGDEIVIVAGAFPYHLVVLGVASMPTCAPEYPIDAYMCVPMP